MNYGDALSDIHIGMMAESDHCLKPIVSCNSLMNPCVRRAKYVGLEEVIDKIMRNLKDMYNSGSYNLIKNFACEISSCNVVYFVRIEDDLRRSMSVRKQRGNHTKLD